MEPRILVHEIPQKEIVTEFRRTGLPLRHYGGFEEGFKAARRASYEQFLAGLRPPTNAIVNIKLV